MYRGKQPPLIHDLPQQLDCVIRGGGNVCLCKQEVVKTVCPRPTDSHAPDAARPLVETAGAGGGEAAVQVEHLELSVVCTKENARANESQREEDKKIVVGSTNANFVGCTYAFTHPSTHTLP